MSERNRSSWSSLVHAAAGGDVDAARQLMEDRQASVRDARKARDETQRRAEAASSSFSPDAVGGEPEGSASGASFRDREEVDGGPPRLGTERDGDVEAARALVASGQGPRVRKVFSQAAYQGRIDIVRVFLEEGVDPDTREQHGATMLMIAATQGRTDVVRALLDAGADLNAVGGKGETALSYAVMAGAADVAEVLLDAGIHPNPIPGSELTAIEMAVGSGTTDVVRMLIARGAHHEVSESFVVGAVRERHVDALRVLVEQTPHRGVRRVLHSAVGHGQVDVVRTLVEAGVDVRAALEDGSMPLLVAANGGHGDVTRVLIDAGADPNAVGETGMTALMASASGGHADVARTLLDAGADATAVWGEPKVTALMVAAANGHADVVRVLLDAGVDPNTTATQGETAYVIAEQLGHDGVARMLKEAGADVGEPFA